MKPSDFRVGNFIGTKEGIKVITAVYERGVDFDAAETEEFKDLQPIPLTPALLEKLGGFAKTGLLSIGSNMSDQVRYFIDTGEDQIIGEEIKYLHEVQNYYHALHRKDLPINLNELQQA